MHNDYVTIRKDEYDSLLNELDERRKLCRVQAEYREECILARLNELGEKLSVEYGDFIESIDFPMDDVLGEIYREKLKSIYRIVTSFGITL